jgi:hypothetical protein
MHANPSHQRKLAAALQYLGSRWCLARNAPRDYVKHPTVLDKAAPTCARAVVLQLPKKETAK